jgi:SOS-response transcriptional repressor LexA
MKSPTERQIEILRFVDRYWQEHNLPPTYRTIGRHFGMQPAGAMAHVKAIAKKGALQFLSGEGSRNRGFLVTDIGKRWCDSSPTPSLVTAKHDIRNLISHEDKLRQRFAEYKATGDSQAFLDWLETHLG